MILFISPAKSLDFESTQTIGETTGPVFLEQAVAINKKLRKLSRKKIGELQSISSKLAALNYERNQVWEKDSKNTRQAVLAFTGDVYQGLEPDKWGPNDMKYANQHLRILSGLYGVLKPSDLIKPYRLEMGTSLPVGRRKDLYHFWADKLKNYFSKEINPEELIVNLASNEYFKAIEKAGLPNPVLDIEFQDYSNGEFKIISFYAKKARGMMANYIIKNRIEEPDKLKFFEAEGYYFDTKLSTDSKFVFLRTEKN